MTTLEQLAKNDRIQEEYRKSFLLNLFQKLCVRMNRDIALKAKIQTLFRQSYDLIQTTQLIVAKELDCDISEQDAELVQRWIFAYLSKSSVRKSFSAAEKNKLIKEQNGKCAVCGEDLSNKHSEIHIDHIIPWILVGDELDDNYQALCETCNECKSAKTDYIFKALLNLI